MAPTDASKQAATDAVEVKSLEAPSTGSPPALVLDDYVKPRTWGEVFAWFPQGTTAEEKRVLYKVDFSILAFGCLSYFTKNLDTSSLSNAYASGMKEDLNLGGNDLNYLNAVYYASYLAFMIPGSLALTRLPARWILPTLEVLWGVSTFGCAWVQNLTQLYVCRFLLGAFETLCMTGTIYIIGSWYKRSEMGMRVALFQVSSPLGTMFSGYLQTAAYENLSGVGGLEGWRWLYVICFVITVPCALLGYMVFPSTPDKTKPMLLLKQEDIDLMKRRLAVEHMRPPDKKIRLQVVTRMLKRWRFWLFVLAWCFFDQIGYVGKTPFTLYLKAEKYSVPKINNLPTIGQAISIVLSLVQSFYSDKTGDRFSPCVFNTVLCMLGSYILAAWNVKDGAKMFAWIIMGVETAMNPLLMSWASDATMDDHEERSLVTASMNCIGQAFVAWTPIFTYPSDGAPRFRVGNIFTAVCTTCHFLQFFVMQYLFLRDRKRERAARLQRWQEENGAEMVVVDEKRSMSTE
ncbi:major facilitator superfamily domain-containing protein [Dipodascopsis tothii]|uniref:major facilitator superfamily domain-containing protein n=1 Tax=Dipodascopsis tothii TaxID=44089 RepID=UPI0034D01EA5